MEKRKKNQRITIFTSWYIHKCSSKYWTYFIMHIHNFFVYIHLSHCVIVSLRHKIKINKWNIIGTVKTCSRKKVFMWLHPKVQGGSKPQNTVLFRGGEQNNNPDSTYDFHQMKMQSHTCTRTHRLLQSFNLDEASTYTGLWLWAPGTFSQYWNIWPL